MICAVQQLNPNFPGGNFSGVDLFPVFRCIVHIRDDELSDTTCTVLVVSKLHLESQRVDLHTILPLSDSE